MKIIYKGEGGFSSQNINFSPNEKEYDVSPEAGVYLTKTFPNFFDKVLEKVEKTTEKVEKEIEKEPKAVAVKKAK